MFPATSRTTSCTYMASPKCNNDCKKHPSVIQLACNKLCVYRWIATRKAAILLCIKIHMERGKCVVCNDKLVTINRTLPDGTVLWKKKCWRHSITDEKYKRVQEKSRARQKKNGYRTARKSSWKKQGIVMTIEKYNDMVLSVGGRCEICGIHESSVKIRLAIDHNHKTGEIRGLLCSYCNRGIGWLKDDIQVLKKAIKYLQR